MKQILSAFFALSLTTATAQAAGTASTTGPANMGGGHAPPSPDQMFAEMDTNGDGVISKAEFLAFHASHHGGPPPQGGQNGAPPQGGANKMGGNGGPPPHGAPPAASNGTTTSTTH